MRRRPDGGLVEQVVQHRQREGRRLAGAGGRLGEHVAAGQQQRDRFALHRRRLFVAERGDGVHEGTGQAKRGKAAAAGCIAR